MARLNLTGICAKANTCKSCALFRSRNMDQHLERTLPEADTCSMDSANIGPTSWIKDLILLIRDFEYLEGRNASGDLSKLKLGFSFII